MKQFDGLAWISNKLRIPAIGFLYLIRESIVLKWIITDNEGNYLFDFKVNKTITQETINGGEIKRENAYLPMEYSSTL